MYCDKCNPLPPEVPIQVTRKQFIEALSDTMQELATIKGHNFLNPFGTATRPYDVLQFEGWGQLMNRLGFKNVT